MRSNSSILPSDSLRDSSIFPRRRRFSKMLSAGGQVPTQIEAPASAIALAMANPNPPSSATPATSARLPERSMGSMRAHIARAAPGCKSRDSSPWTRSGPRSEARRTLLRAPLAHRGRRRRDLLLARAPQAERLGRPGDQLDQLDVAPALLRLAVEELDGARAGARAVVRAVGGDRVEDVRELQDLRRQRELGSLEPVRVAGPVEALVVPADDGEQVPQALERLADALPAGV